MKQKSKDELVVQCDTCGCDFLPNIKTCRNGEIEHTFFNCDYCGRTYVVSVTDEALRKQISRYKAYVKSRKLLSKAQISRSRKLKADNIKRTEELIQRYPMEDETVGENN